MVVTDIDQIIGENIRRYRRLRGLTLDALGTAIGVTYEQIRKFEVGKDRVTASQLYGISLALDVHVSIFFQSL